MTSAPRALFVDLGSRSLVAFVIEVDEARGCYRCLWEGRQLTQLGAGLGATGQLSKEAMCANLEALGLCYRQAEAFGLAAVEVVGTEALRVASNAQDFVAAVRANLQLELRILTAQEESAYQRLGLERSPKWRELFRHQAFARLDWGGRSLEFEAFDRQGQRLASWSRPLGILALCEAEAPEASRAVLREFWREALAVMRAKPSQDEASALLLAGGSLLSAFSRLLGQDQFELSAIESSRFKLAQILAGLKPHREQSPSREAAVLGIFFESLAQSFPEAEHWSLYATGRGLRHGLAEAYLGRCLAHRGDGTQRPRRRVRS